MEGRRESNDQAYQGTDERSVEEIGEEEEGLLGAWGEGVPEVVEAGGDAEIGVEGAFGTD